MQGPRPEPGRGQQDRVAGGMGAEGDEGGPSRVRMREVSHAQAEGTVFTQREQQREGPEEEMSGVVSGSTQQRAVGHAAWILGATGRI